MFAARHVVLDEGREAACHGARKLLFLGELGELPNTLVYLLQVSIEEKHGVIEAPVVGLGHFLRRA